MLSQVSMTTDAVFWPAVFSTVLTSESKNEPDNDKDDTFVSMNYILTDYCIPHKKWKQKFNENSIQSTLTEKLQSKNIKIEFVYRRQKIKKTKKQSKKQKAVPNKVKAESNKVKSESHEVLNSVDRRKKIKKRRVIADSDTDSD